MNGDIIHLQECVYRLDKEVQNVLEEVNLHPRFVNCVIMVDIPSLVPSMLLKVGPSQVWE